MNFGVKVDFLITPLPRRKIYKLVTVAANRISTDVQTVTEFKMSQD